MRPPWRAVGDDDVDRPQVGARRRVEPSGTNGPSGLRTVAPSRASEVCVPFPRPVEGRRRHEWRHRRGGAPLPIPNREVKPRCGDDTAGDRGKVVRRPPTTEKPQPDNGWVFLFFCFGTKQKFTETASPVPLLPGSPCLPGERPALPLPFCKCDRNVCLSLASDGKTCFFPETKMRF